MPRGWSSSAPPSPRRGSPRPRPSPPAPLLLAAGRGRRHRCPAAPRRRCPAAPPRHSPGAPRRHYQRLGRRRCRLPPRRCSHAGARGPPAAAHDRRPRAARPHRARPACRATNHGKTTPIESSSWTQEPLALDLRQLSNARLPPTCAAAVSAAYGRSPTTVMCVASACHSTRSAPSTSPAPPGATWP